MSHAVHYRSADGNTRFEEAASLDDALTRVEQLRNEQGVSEVRVYREVPVTFRTYYKATVLEEPAPPPVTVADDPAPAPDAVPEGPPEPAAAAPPPGAMPLAPPVSPADGRDGAAEGRPGGRGSLFTRG